MSLESVIAMLKAMIPALEPIGEGGVNALFDAADAWVLTVKSPDEKLFLQFVLPGARQFAIAEMKKIAA